MKKLSKFSFFILGLLGLHGAIVDSSAGPVWTCGSCSCDGEDAVAATSFVLKVAGGILQEVSDASNVSSATAAGTRIAAKWASVVGDTLSGALISKVGNRKIAVPGFDQSTLSLIQEITTYKPTQGVALARGFAANINIAEDKTGGETLFWPDLSGKAFFELDITKLRQGLKTENISNLVNNDFTPEERDQAQQQLDKIDAWVASTLSPEIKAVRAAMSKLLRDFTMAVCENAYTRFTSDVSGTTVTFSLRGQINTIDFATLYLPNPPVSSV